MNTRHMATVTRKRSGFGDILRRELEAQGISTRALARRLTAAQPDRIESARRQLIRYINGEHTPGDAMRQAIADALGIDVAAFAEDAVRQARRDKVMDALAPLADVLLDLAIEVAARERETA